MKRALRAAALLAAGMIGGGAWAQGSAPPAVLPMQTPAPTALATYATSAELKTMIARARSMIQPGQPLILQPIHKFGAYTMFLEYRRGPWTAAVHPDIELFFVVEGAGTLVTGGSIPDAKPGTNGNSSGSRIDGGTTLKVGKGDFFFVPPQTAHQFPDPKGELVLISMHIPASTVPPKP